MSNGAEMVDTGISQNNKRAFRNPWVIGWVGLVAVVLGVNIFMITMAFVSNPGLVSKDPYNKGREYERTLQSRIAARDNLNWDLSLQQPAQLNLGQPAAFRLTATDKVGQPLAGGQVVISAYRPSDAQADFKMPLAEVNAGQYVGDLLFPLRGVWDLNISVKRDDDVYQVTRRVTVLGN